MDDKRIIELFFARDEKAIEETEKKYGGLCRFIASNILALREDVEECISDILLALWNAIPPERPQKFPAYLTQIIKRIAINKYKEKNSW